MEFGSVNLHFVDLTILITVNRTVRASLHFMSQLYFVFATTISLSFLTIIEPSRLAFRRPHWRHATQGRETRCTHIVVCLLVQSQHAREEETGDHNNHRVVSGFPASAES
jgi:hypothetical protein